MATRGQKKYYYYRKHSIANDPDYQEIIDRAEGEGFTLPSVGDQQKQNDFIKAEKANGSWSRYAAFFCWGLSGSEDFKRINWKDPSGTLATITGTPGFNGGGVFCSPGNYIDTQFTASGSILTTTSLSMGLWLTNVPTTTDSRPQSVTDGSGNRMWLRYRTGAAEEVALCSLNLTFTPANDPGFHCVTRLNTDMWYFVGATSLGPQTPTDSGTLPTLNFIIGGRNNNGTLDNFWNARQGVNFWAQDVSDVAAGINTNLINLFA